MAHQPDWPCDGDANVQCCVKNEDMSDSTTSGTSTNTPIPTVPSSTLQSNTPSSLPTQASPSPPGLASSQIGGIAGGVAGAVLLLAFAGLLFFRKRKQARSSGMTPPGISSAPDKTPQMIDGSEIKGMDADMRQGSPSLARHELPNLERQELPSPEVRQELPSPESAPRAELPGPTDR